jgi:hypothetical protein
MLALHRLHAELHEQQVVSIFLVRNYISIPLIPL